MRRELIALVALVTFGVSAHADEYPDPLLCGHRITTAYMAGFDLACHVQFGRKGHITRVDCANRQMRITGGKVGVSGMGEVKGTLEGTDRKKRFRASVRGWLSFSGNLTVAMQKDGDWRVHGLQGTAKIRPTCGGLPSVFDEVAP